MKKAVLIGLAIAGALVAQRGPGGPMWGGPGGPMGRGPGGGEMRNPVTGAPYMGTETVTTQQVLANGNSIQRQSQSSVFRDGQGRMRIETTRPAMPGAASTEPVKVVRISDPVAGVEHNLDVQRKTSHEMLMPGRQRGTGAAASGSTSQANGRGPRNQARTTTPDPNVVTENLGMQTINGIAATGTRVTRTIPAGTVGNAQPIQIVHETWRSDDLKVPVMVKTSDPRFGSTVTQLTNVNRTEPDPTLFQVPSDYTKVSGPGRGGRGAGRPQVR